MSAPCSPEAYLPFVDSDFFVSPEAGPEQMLRLISVDKRIDDSVQLCFSLLFQGTSELIAEGTHSVAHPELGSFPLSLVAIRRKSNGTIVYQAVFNLLLDEDEL